MFHCVVALGRAPSLQGEMRRRTRYLAYGQYICTMTLRQVMDGIRGPMGEVDTMATLVSRSLNSAILMFHPRDERELSKGAKAKSGDFERYEDMKLEHHWNGYGGK